MTNRISTTGMTVSGKGSYGGGRGREGEKLSTVEWGSAAGTAGSNTSSRNHINTNNNTQQNRSRSRTPTAIRRGPGEEGGTQSSLRTWMESKGKGDGTPPRVQEDDSADKRARTSGAPMRMESGSKQGGEEEDGDVAMGKEGDEEDKDEVEDEDTDEGEDDNMEEDMPGYSRTVLRWQRGSRHDPK